MRDPAAPLQHSSGDCILRQTVQLTADETVADLFGATEALALLRRAESGKASAEELADADRSLDARIATALGRVASTRPIAFLNFTSVAGKAWIPYYRASLPAASAPAADELGARP